MRVLTCAALAAATVASPAALSSPISLASAMTCEDLSSLEVPHTTITSAVRETSGVIDPAIGMAGATGLPPFCRVAGTISPTADSRILFEVWMPLESWNGRFSGVGNGGWAGAISRTGGQGGGLASQIKLGYASASSDTGHRGALGLDAARFAFDRPERFVDYAYRAQHEMTLAAKAIIKAFYGRAPHHSYWIGGSTGGRQGLMEAQRFPGDYDGILAGAPANNFTHLMAGDLDAIIAVLKNAGSNLPASALETLHRSVLTACDATDGIEDGVLEDPRRCVFDPATVQCVESHSSGCLTPQQVAAARRVYEGLKDPSSGAQLFPGLLPGSEPNWETPFDPASPFDVPISYFRWLVFADPSWDWRTFDFADPKDYAVFQASDKTLAPIVNATDPDLREFQRLGGKLLQYHGWADQLISPQNSIDYYESVVTLFGTNQDGRVTALRRVQEFYRLFMVPALAHQPPQAANFLQAALVQWVESGRAPNSLLSEPPDRVHLLCAFPSVAVQKRNSAGDGATVCEDVAIK